jgi:hypothetical protein
MNPAEQVRVEVKAESAAIHDFARVMQAGPSPLSRSSAGGHGRAARINLDPDKIKNGLGQLVLTVVKLLHELLEKQAIRRMEAGSLTEAEIERLGLTLLKQAQEIEKLRKEFHLEEADLNIDLGPLGTLLKGGP